MAKKIELLMPKVGESINEATILNWLKQEGDDVEADEPVLEIATDKVDTEVPAPVGGKIHKILHKKDDVVEVGKPLAIMETTEETGPEIPVVSDDGESSAPAKEEKKEEPAATAQQEEKPAPQKAPEPATAPEGGTTAPARKDAQGRFYSPLVRNIARQENISMEELETISGTGQNGRVTKKDIFSYLENRKGAPAAKPAAASSQAATAKQTSQEIPSSASGEPESVSKYREVVINEGDEVEEMDRMRKMISEHMVASKKISPHVTSFVEADVTNIVKWREKVKKDFEKREGEKLTFTPIFIEAVTKALKDYPGVNAAISGDKVIKRKNVDMGMAAALPTGNLIVPVIKKADHKNLIGLTKEVNDLANRARNNKLKPDEIQGGSFTITNVGTFGNVMGTPIIMQPQVAILAIGAIRKKPVVIERPEGDFIGIRHMMFLSHSYDHRAVDGALGGAFVKQVANYLEEFDPDRKI